MGALFHGVILALGLILPLGVQNVFVFNQGATHKKFRNALPVGRKSRDRDAGRRVDRQDHGHQLVAQAHWLPEIRGPGCAPGSSCFNRQAT